MADTVKLECKIHDIKQVPNTTIQIVSVHFKLGKRSWYKAFRLNYDRPISMEEFQRDLVRAGVFPEKEEDFLAFIKEEAEKPFTIEVEAPDKNVSNLTDSVGSQEHN